MTPKIRRLVFYSLTAVFVISAFIIIPYSNGWHFNPKTFSFVKLGGFYLETKPADAQIEIDKIGMQIKPGFLRSGVLVANLFPKTYGISAQKEGYQSWNKNVTVKPFLISRLYPIILLPQKWNKKVLAENILEIFPGTNYLALKDKNQKLKIDKKIIKGDRFMAWLAGDKSALTYDEKTKNFFVVNAAQNNTALNINLIFENLKYQNHISDNYKINKIIGHPLDKNKLIIATDKSLYLLDFNKPFLEIIKKGGFNLLGAAKENMFFSDLQNLYSYNLDKKEESVILKQKDISSLEASPDGQFLAVSGEDKLILIDRNNPDKPEELAENPVYFKFSPDSKKIAVVRDNNHRINIFFIGDDYETFNKKPLSSSFFEIGLLDNDSPISWHNSSAYIFLKYPDSLHFLEIDDAPPINLQVVDNNAEKYFYDQKNDFIYLTEKSVVYKIYEK